MMCGAITTNCITEGCDGMARYDIICYQCIKDKALNCDNLLNKKQPPPGDSEESPNEGKVFPLQTLLKFARYVVVSIEDNLSYPGDIRCCCVSLSLRRH